MKKWSVLSESDKIGKKELVLGMELYNQCITNKDVHNAMKIAAELAAEATRAGQTLQACRVLKLMTPDGQLYYLEKSIQKMNEEFREKLGDKYKDIELNEELMKEFLEEKDEAKRNEAYDKLCQDIADQIPATFMDKWNSWRYLAMLGNTKTHIRNIVGNAVFLPAVRLKNYVGAVIERTAGVIAEDRTKSMRKSKEAVDFAKRDFESMSKTLQGENAKYAITSDIEGKRTIFKHKLLEKLRVKNFEFLEKEDMWFLKAHYVVALARVITVRKLDVSSISEKDLNAAIAIAVKEAQAATYRDANALAEGLAKLQRKLERGGKGKRAVYSPVKDLHTAIVLCCVRDNVLVCFNGQSFCQFLNELHRCWKRECRWSRTAVEINNIFISLTIPQGRQLKDLNKSRRRFFRSDSVNAIGKNSSHIL